MATRSISLIGSENTRVEVEDSGGNFIQVPGIQSYEETGGAATQRPVTTFDGAGQLSGHQLPPTISCTAVHLPHHPAWQLLRQKANDRELARIRVTTKGEVILANTSASMLSISLEGVVTSSDNSFDPANNEYAPGMVIQDGLINRVISTITDEGVMTVVPFPDQVVTDQSDFSVVVPIIRRGPYTANVLVADNSSLSAEGNLSVTLELSARSVIVEWEIIRE